MKKVYCDISATTPINNEVVDYFKSQIDCGNIKSNNICKMSQNGFIYG